MSLQVAGATIIRDTLLTIADVTSLVGQKIFWEDVEAGVNPPYIYVSHVLGGYSNRGIQKYTASETTWRVVGLVPDMPTAVLMAKAIAQLQGMSPILTGVVNITCNATIGHIGDIFDRLGIQSHAFAEVGAFFTLDLAHH